MPRNTLGTNLNLCFTKLKRPLPPQPSHHEHQQDNSMHFCNSTPSTLIKNFNSLYDISLDCTSNLTSSTYSTNMADEYDCIYEFATTTPDLASVFASQRFFFSSPGHSNSIIDSSSMSSSLASTSSSVELPESDTLIDGSIAIPTYSPDPYLDFRRSMQEMVEARNLSDIRTNWDSLHELLMCYLTLNPKSTHKYIVGAFADLIVCLMASKGVHSDRPNSLSDPSSSTNEAVTKVSVDTMTIFGKYRAWADSATPTAPIQVSGESSSQSSSQSGRTGSGTSSFGGLDQLLMSEQEEYGEEYTEFQVYIMSRPKKLTDFSSDQLLDFWKTQEPQFPILSKMARDILTIQASSVASESAFSQGRFQIGDHRHSLREEAMETAVLFRDWIRAERRNFGLPELSKKKKRAYIETILGEGTSEEGSQTGNEEYEDQEEDEDEEQDDDDEVKMRRPVPKEKPTSIIKKFANMFKRM